MPELSLLDVAKEDPMFVATFRPNIVDSVLAGGRFAKAGIQKGDSLLAFNGTPLNSWNEFMDEMGKLRSKAELEKKTSASFSLVYSRQGVRDTVTVQTNEQFMVDAVGGLVSYKETNLSYGFFESFPAGVTLGINTLKGYVNDMKYVFTKEGAKSVGGFGTIGSIFPKVWGIGSVSGNDSFPFYYFGVYEYPADSGTRWRSCIVLAIRNYRSS